MLGQNCLCNGWKAAMIMKALTMMMMMMRTMLMRTMMMMMMMMIMYLFHICNWHATKTNKKAGDTSLQIIIENFNACYDYGCISH
jgi:hypothetical protein